MLSAQIGNDQSVPGSRGRRACSRETHLAVCPVASGGRRAGPSGRGLVSLTLNPGPLMLPSPMRAWGSLGSESRNGMDGVFSRSPEGGSFLFRRSLLFQCGLRDGGTL